MQISLKISTLLVGSALALSACGGLNSGGSLNSAGSGSAGSGSVAGSSAGGSLGGSGDANQPRRVTEGEPRGETIFDLLNPPDEGAILGVNKYLWRATTEVLSFLPLEAADPFTGTLVYGYGTAPGSSRAYRVTVLISDPALDARALKVAVRTRGGAASAELQRQIEDAILTRARQLRISRANI